jgi:plastocyanin
MGNQTLEVRSVGLIAASRLRRLRVCNPLIGPLEYFGNIFRRGASHLHMYMKSSSKKILIGAATALWCLALTLSSLGATVNVSVINFAFVPAATNINPGDKVIWTWVPGANFHNVTSQSVPSAWPASATLNGPATFSVTFPNAGNFPYECTVHLFTGSINVASANVPPTVSITNPVAGTVFSEPANVTIQVTATNSAGTVTNVQFLVGSTVLTNEAAPPFSAITDNLAAGSYMLSAIASDNMGVRATNAVAISVVTPVPIIISALQFSSTSFQFDYAANVGLRYVVQYSTNLAPPNWTAIATNTAASNPQTFVDTDATNSPAFYRVGQLPNP